jgi:predicted nucleic acid-binding protein
MGKTHTALGAALAGLERDCLNPNHEYWPADIDLRDLGELGRKRLIGHNQIADMQLLMLAHRHGGRLVTFDAGLRALASGTKYADSLLVLAP